MKLSKAESRALLSLVAEREEVEGAIRELVEFYSSRHGMEAASIEQRPDGLYLVEKDSGENNE